MYIPISDFHFMIYSKRKDEVDKKEIENHESDISDSENPMFSNKEHPMFQFLIP